MGTETRSGPKTRQQSLEEKTSQQRDETETDNEPDLFTAQDSALSLAQDVIDQYYNDGGENFIEKATAHIKGDTMSIAATDERIEAGVAIDGINEQVQKPLEEAKTAAANHIGQTSVKGYEDLEKALREAYGHIDKAIESIDLAIAVHGAKHNTE